jgi:uroporphyrinogen-III synthase
MDLKHKTILVTRPMPQGEILCEKLRALNGNAIAFPTIDIKPLQDYTPLKEQIAQLDQYDWLIFVSPQAVQHCHALLHAAWPVLPSELKIAAVGLGTANALQAVNLPVTACPTQWSSEGLLSMPLLQQVQGLRIVIVSGEGGRELLAETLAERGAEIIRMITYRRCLPVYQNITDYLALFQARKIDIIVVTSGEGLHNLITLIGDVELIRTLPLVVMSERLVGIAEEFRFKQIILADNASDTAIIDALIKGINYGR